MTHASVQATRLGLNGIENGVMRLAGGKYRAILEVVPSGDLLDDAGRQDAVLAGYAAFLNALSYPVQILVRAVPVDLGGYVSEVEERAHRALSPDLAAIAADHASFVHALSRRRTLLERRFYVVVPADDPRVSRWFGARHVATDQMSAVDAARRQLTFRCEELIRQLARSGLVARRLGDLEVAHLVLASWSMERARAQRFRQRLEDYSTLAVRTDDTASQASPLPSQAGA